MATIRKKIDVSAELTSEQLNMLKEAENTEYVFDEDNPILSREELAQFRRVSDLIKEERENNQKQNVTLRLSPRVLAKIVEKALDNPELTELLMKR